MASMAGKGENYSVSWLVVSYISDFLFLGLEGDWQFISDDGYDPAKITVKNIMADDWMVACMIPKGKMMANMLKRNKEDGLFKLVKFTSNSVESPEENKKLEDQLVSFLEKGISNITKEGKTF